MIVFYFIFSFCLLIVYSIYILFSLEAVDIFTTLTGGWLHVVCRLFNDPSDDVKFKHRFLSVCNSDGCKNVCQRDLLLLGKEH